MPSPIAESAAEHRRAAYERPALSCQDGLIRAYLPTGQFPGRTGTISTGTTSGKILVTLLERRTDLPADDVGWRPTSPPQQVMAYNDVKMQPPAGADVILLLRPDNDGKIYLEGYECS